MKIQSTYLNYLNGVEELVKKIPLSSEELVQLKADISRTELLVPVIGAFSAGKSSLLNTFLGEDILGVGLTPETELATEIRYGTDPHLLALHPDGSSERIELKNLSSVKSRASEFTHLQLFLDNPQLREFSSLVLVDMPGFGSSLANHNKAIAYYLPRGAHFIVVTSVEDGNITQSMMRQIDDLQTYECGFTFILNKINLRSDEQVDDVAAIIEEQIRFSFCNNQPLVRIGHDGYEKLSGILAALVPEQIFQKLFIDKIKDLTHTYINHINLAVASLKNNKTENEYTLHELARGIRQIKAKRDTLVSDLRNDQTVRIVERCLSRVGSELENAQDELVNAGLSGNQDNISRIVSEVVRSSLSRTIKNEMDTIGSSIVSEFAISVDSIETSLSQFNQGQGWLEQFSDKINKGLLRTGAALDQWSESLADRNKRELERLKKESGWKDGQQLPRVSFQGLATVLAVTTSIVNPLVELAIIFLPNIISFINQNRQREQLKQKIINEVIPAVRREIRDKLTMLMNEQLNTLINQISDKFECEIAEKQRIIDEQTANRDQLGQSIEQQIDRLLEIKEELQQLASNSIYQGGAE